MDFKHTVFGKIKEGYSVLDKLEGFETGEGGLPKKDIIITRTIVHRNPYRSTIAEILEKDWKVLH